MKRNILIPESFDELTPKQFDYLLHRYWRFIYDASINEDDIRNDFANYLLGRCRYINPNKREDYFRLVNQISESLSWIFTTTGDNETILNIDTTINFQPILKKLVGPQDFGIDLRFGEFRIACDIMNCYNDDEDDYILDALVGVLYRKPSKYIGSEQFDGNFRVKFNKHKIDTNERTIRHIAEYKKYGVYLWFANFCKYLISGDFHIEGRDVNFAPIFGVNEDADSKRDDDKLGMLSILFTLADAGTFGTFEETDNALLLDVMCKLLNDHITAKNLRK
jgi:hypothetical protein